VEPIQRLVKAALMRLLANPAWMPGSVKVGPGRIEVRITIEQDSEVEGVRARAQANLADQIARTRSDLQRLEAELENEAEDA
jgi:hypothetical protein